MRLKALAAGGAVALTLAGAAAAGTYRVPSHITVALHKHVSVTVEKQRASNGVIGGGLLTAAAAYIGVDRPTLVADLKGGQSLAQVATAHGKTAAGLVTALLAPAKLRLDAAVAAGRLTSDRETALLSRLQTLLTNVVGKTVTAKTPATRPVRIAPGLVLRAATGYLGVDLKTIFHDVAAGQTLAAIAVAHGKTASGLVDAVVAAAKTTLDAQVSAGRITAQQETDFLTQFRAAATTLVNGS